ncbi:C-terminal binding protein [Microtetraspora glauca]|uniref:C-terminal binding protein n=1 Tax=Microtetraspora glauca TaxID=1996 RepID=A0ABV3G964_MICGL
MNKKVVVTDHAFRDVSFEERAAWANGAGFACFSCTGEAETAAAVDGADVVLVNFAPITHKVLSRMRPGATVIRYGIGYDNVDIDAARELGVRVANVPDYGVETVADHAAAGLLALARRIPVYNHRIRGEGWVLPGDVGPIRGFRSMVVGLVGLGRIAQALHTRLVPFGFEFIAYDPFCRSETFERLGIESVDLVELARRSHAISLHAPSTRETFRMINGDFFAELQPGAVLVNTARGPLIDEAALATAISEGRLAAVVLDVTDPEPLPLESPLRDVPEIIFTPHAAFYDEDSLRRLQELASDEAGRALRDEPLRCQII